MVHIDSGLKDGSQGLAVEQLSERRTKILVGLEFQVEVEGSNPGR